VTDADKELRGLYHRVATNPIPLLILMLGVTPCERYAGVSDKKCGVNPSREEDKITMRVPWMWEIMLWVGVRGVLVRTSGHREEAPSPNPGTSAFI
jgi:hypothetical protein